MLWGSIASRYGLATTLIASAVTLLVLLLATWRVRVRMGDEADITPGMPLPDLALNTEPLPDDGPVLIQVQYCIEAKDSEAFVARRK